MQPSSIPSTAATGPLGTGATGAIGAIGVEPHTPAARPGPVPARRAGRFGLRGALIGSALVHCGLIAVAAVVMTQAPRVETTVEREEVVTRLDLRAVTIADERRKEPTFDAHAQPRAGVPDAPPDELVRAGPPAPSVLDDWDADTLVTPPPAPGAHERARPIQLAHATRLPARVAADAGIGGSSGSASGALGSASGEAGTDGGSGLAGASGNTPGSGRPGTLGVAGGTGAQATGLAQPDQPPVLIEGSDPTYPLISRRAGEEGRVECRLAIDDQGLVTRVEILTSSGFARLDEAARTALATWRFRPAAYQGRAVACTLEHGVTFRLVAR